ncbi:HK97-gp10 family putative phage morphogenesis protein [Escherichia coli]
MMDFSLDFSGLADIARDLETLSRAENNKVLRDATRAGDPRNAFYWRFVELGTINMPAHPFIRPAFDTTEELAAQIAIQRMNQAIDEVLSK